MFFRKKITPLLFCLLSALLAMPSLLGMSSATLTPLKGKALAVFTDYEADDAVAIGLLLKFLKEQQIKRDYFLIGALLSNQHRKKALVQEMVKLFGYDAHNVYAGTGGIKEPFEEEGKSILSPESLEKFKELDKKYLESHDPTIHQDQELHERFTALLQATDSNSVDVLVLTNPIDFVKALAQNKDNFYKINKIYMMGGWFGNKPSFNWSLHIESIRYLLEQMKNAQGHPHSPQLILFSSHFFAREFNGYVNQNKFPEVIQAFDQNKSLIINHLRNMVKNWDDSMTIIKDHHNDSDKKWRQEMVERIGKDNIGRQFAPADPATVLGYLYPKEFIQELIPTQITLTTSIDSNSKRVNTVENRPDPLSNVYVVEKIHLQFFNNKLVELMSMS